MILKYNKYLLLLFLTFNTKRVKQDISLLFSQIKVYNFKIIYKKSHIHKESLFMLHLTNWERSKCEKDKIYSSAKDYSKYWENKLKFNFNPKDANKISDLFASLERIFSIFQSADSQENIDQLKNILNNSSQSQELLREYIFEEIRLEKFPDLPSRKNCMFCLPDNCTLKSAREVFNLSIEYRPTTLRIEGVKGEHIFCECDANWLNCNIKKINEVKESAYKYWDGHKTEKPMIEILFSGSFTIKEIL